STTTATGISSCRSSSSEGCYAPFERHDHVAYGTSLCLVGGRSPEHTADTPRRVSRRQRVSRERRRGHATWKRLFESSCAPRPAAPRCCSRQRLRRSCG